MAKYSRTEFLYARPVADALLTDGEFRRWFLGGTRFADCAFDAVPLADQPKKERTTPDARKWFWFNCFCGTACECKVETGIETDIFIVFQSPDQSRFALHIEVKGDKEGLEPGQAESYCRRGRCWASEKALRPQAVPKWIPPYDDFVTVLICGDSQISDQRIFKFDAVVFHKDIEQRISPYPDSNDMRE